MGFLVIGVPRRAATFVQKDVAMAKMSDTADVDYWPGYVDALTSMVKVLTFMMMLLSLTVFTITQQLSRNVVVKIAEAAGVKVEPGVPLNLIAERVMTKLSERNATDAAQASTEVAAQKSAPNVEDKVSIGRAIEETTGAVLPDFDDARDLLTLKFVAQAVKLDVPANESIDRLIQLAKTRSGSLRIVSFSGQSGSVTEQRRISFYRLMAVRQALIAGGIAKDRISTTLVDSATATDDNLVRVSLEQVTPAPDSGR
jgi:outer membrane protein OmpA-like peptidoglycan-associated protein